LTTVTTAAGLSIGIVNFHFKGKNALLKETLRFLAEEHRDLWMKQVTGSGRTAAEKIGAIVDAQFHPRVCNRKKLAVWYAFFGETEYRKSYRQVNAGIDAERVQICEDLCRQVIEEGGYDQSPQEISHMLEGMFDGLWLNILMSPDSFSRNSALVQIRNYLSLCFPQHFERSTL